MIAIPAISVTSVLTDSWIVSTTRIASPIAASAAATVRKATALLRGRGLIPTRLAWARSAWSWSVLVIAAVAAAAPIRR